MPAQNLRRVLPQFRRRRPDLPGGAGHLEGANHLTGKVDSITYLGSIVRIRLNVEGNPVSMDMFNERKLKIPAVGEPFEVNFDADACWLI